MSLFQNSRKTRHFHLGLRFAIFEALDLKSVYKIKKDIYELVEVENIYEENSGELEFLNTRSSDAGSLEQVGRFQWTFGSLHYKYG